MAEDVSSIQDLHKPANIMQTSTALLRDRGVDPERLTNSCVIRMEDAHAGGLDVGHCMYIARPAIAWYR